MKHAAAWLMGVLVGVSGCGSAVVGGDVSAQSGGAAGSSAGGNFPMTSGGIGGGVVDPVAGGADSGGAPTVEAPPSCHSTVDAWIVFDSDSSEIPFESGSVVPNRDLYLTRPDGSQWLRLTAEPSIEIEPYFSPTGDRLSFTSFRTGSPQIYIMDLPTRTVKQVTDRAEGADQSSFSADGRLLAFHSGASLYTVEPDGSNETLIVAGLDADNAYGRPRFIASDQLVFDREYEIDAIDLDKTDFRNIVANSRVPVTSPTVSPRNDEIAYVTSCPDDDRGFSIWTANTSASNSPTCSGRRVTPAQEGANKSHPSWGPGDTFAYEGVASYSSNRRITLIKRAPGSVPCSLTDGSRDSRNPSWSPEGFQLFSPPP